MNGIENAIEVKLRDIEKQESVRILYACESGSRAWGFASTDSDYDVRFIYCHPTNWYLSIRDRRDVIERPLDTDGLDVSGWDIRKTIGLFRKSNPPLLEWLNSPICYVEHGLFIRRLRELMPAYYSPRNCSIHYWNMARHNFDNYLSRETVSLKKYFYVLRPVLACNWIERGLGVVPTEFGKLLDAIVPLGLLREAIVALQETKRGSAELGEGPCIPVIHDFLSAELARLAERHEAAEPVTTDAEALDELFRATLKEDQDNT